jgi:DNA invertase Pin-like site-specific DNA recombinase
MEADDLLKEIRTAFPQVAMPSKSDLRFHPEGCHQCEYLSEYLDENRGKPVDGTIIRYMHQEMGKSGTSSAERHGFQRLIGEISLGKAGLVLSLDASRLARNNRDWHQLLELCSVFGVLIADGERLYEPTLYHDRLLLGLSGIMSEAELHQLRIRLHQGERQKACAGRVAHAVAGRIGKNT